tara:strand:+ start:1430 stop:1654 length:225 start_codon:yes stop_codon:yes gene_type:complete
MVLVECANHAKIAYLVRLRELTMDNEPKYFLYLDTLRNSGVTNMMGAIPYLLEEFEELDRAVATEILTLWMDSK